MLSLLGVSLACAPAGVIECTRFMVIVICCFYGMLAWLIHLTIWVYSPKKFLVMLVVLELFCSFEYQLLKGKLNCEEFVN